MNQSPTPEAVSVLLVYSGDIGQRCTSLLSDSSLDLTVVELGRVPDSLSNYTAVALATDRPYPAVELELDQACWVAGVPWIPAVLLAHEFRVGPAIIPGQTPCHECWTRRVRSQTSDLATYDVINEFGAKSAPGSWFVGELSVLTEQVAALLMAEVLALVTKSYPLPPYRMGRWWEGDMMFACLRSHLFARVGLCGRCAAGEQEDATWLHLSKYFRNMRESESL